MNISDIKANRALSQVKALTSKIDVLNTKAVGEGSGGPKNTFTTLTLLQADASANTLDGRKYIYVVTADGKWYYWNGTLWTAGAVYQSSGIAKGSISVEHTNFLVRGKNLFNKDTCMDGYALNNLANNYSPYANAPATISDYIVIEPNTAYYCNVNNGYLVHYDANKNVISGVNYPAYPVTTPANGQYVRFHSTIANKGLIQFEKGSAASIYEPFTYFYVPLVSLPFDITSKIPSKSITKDMYGFKSIQAENTTFAGRGKNLFDLSLCMDNYALNNAANKYVPYSNTGATVSDYIAVDPSTKYYCNYNNGYLVYYDKFKNVISGVQYPAYPVTTPVDCFYVRFHTTITNKSTLQFEKGSVGTRYLPYQPVVIPNNQIQSFWHDKLWATEGDSITFNGSYQAGIKAALQLHFINYGISGTTLADNLNPNAIVNRFMEISNTVDLITFTGGTNDYAQNIPIGANSSTDKTTFKGAIRTIIEGITLNYPNARLAFFTPIQRGDTSEGANLLGLTIKDYADAMIEMCGIYCIPVLDLFRMSGINKLNINVYTSDKIHPNTAGYHRIIRPMTEFIKSL